MKAVAGSTWFILLLSAAPAFSQSPAHEAQGACGPADVRFDAQTSAGKPLPPQPGKALVYVDEVFKKVPGELGNPTIRVGLDGNWVGAVRANSFTAFYVDPGDHHLCTNWQSHFKRLSREASFAGFTAEADKIYYFRTRITYQTVGTATTMLLDLEPINSDEGQYLVASSPVSTSHPQK